MTSLHTPRDLDWELIVVNNNCTDDTDKVIEQFNGRLPIRRVLETKQGHSNARNAAVAAANGRYLIWTDDDTRVDPHWISAYANAFERWPKCAFFGGPVVPLFAVDLPKWLENLWPRVASAYALHNLGSQPIRLDGGSNIPVGANFVVRRSEQLKFLYDSRFGRFKTDMIGHDENVVIDALLKAGHEGMWVPNAVVQHFIPGEKMTIRYVRRYYYGLGQTESQLAQPVGGPRFLGKPRWMWRYAVTSELRYQFSKISGPRDEWVKRLITASQAWGSLRGGRKAQNRK